MAHLFVRQRSPARKDKRQVGRFECLKAGNVVAAGGVDDPRIRINGKQDRALETVMVSEDSPQLTQGLFRTILVIPGYEDDVLALPGTSVAFVDNPLGIVGCGFFGRRLGRPAGRRQRSRDSEQDNGNMPRG